MINLEISNYPQPFDKLNGTTKQNIRPLDLARSVVTVGMESWGDVINLGIFRITELICKALAFSKIDIGNLILQDSFFDLNQSEKVTISYYFGQGLTKLYSEKHFKIKWLFHVDDYSSFIQFATKGTATPKLRIAKSKKTAKRPDLIGIKTKNEFHIYEAKGNSGGYDATVMQHAINQVSQVRTFNGIAPLTRVACYFDLSGVPIKGIIVDPEVDEYGIDIVFDENAAILKYYTFFMNNKKYFSIPIKIGKFEFLTIPIVWPNLLFGFDKRILNMTSSKLLTYDLYSDELLPLSSEFSQKMEFSLGHDGIILINLNEPF